MNEQRKITEAHDFLAELPSLGNNRDKFTHRLSAFLTAARSVLQYARKEAKHKPGGLPWYDGQVTGNSVVKFLKDARDINIHAKPVSPSANVNLYAGDNKMSPSDSVLIATIRADGTLERQNVSSPAWSAENPPDVRLTVEYFFEGWPGKEDVITLCQMYLKEVERIVADGVAKGFLTV